jgi:glycyl-tRNA synthetase beta chain
MVYEFPELQGIMGAEYARQDGEPEAVAEGIEQHYWPLGAGEALPTSLTGRVVGWADRLDTLVGMFHLGQIPTGSSDRFALRRAANSLVLIAWEADWRLDVNELLRQVVQDYAAGDERTLKALQEFLAQRLQILLQEEKRIDYDLVRAVVGDPESVHGKEPQKAELTLRALSNLPLTLLRAEYLQHLRATGELADLYPTLNRCARLATQGNLDYAVLDPAAAVNPRLFQETAEQELYEACQRGLPAGRGASLPRRLYPTGGEPTGSSPCSGSFLRGGFGHGSGSQPASQPAEPVGDIAQPVSPAGRYGGCGHGRGSDAREEPLAAGWLSQ